MFFHMHIDGFSSLIARLKSQHTDNISAILLVYQYQKFLILNNPVTLSIMALSVMLLCYVKYIPNIVDITNLAHSFLSFSR